MLFKCRQKAFFFAVEVAGKFWYWQLSENRCENIEALPEDSRVIRITERDLRMRVSRQDKEKPEMKALRLLQTKPMLMKSARRDIWYVAPDNSAWMDEDLEIRAIPGSALVDSLVKSPNAKVIGIRLTGELTVLVLWAVDEHGETTRPLIVMHAEVDDTEMHVQSLAEQAELREYETHVIDSEALYERLRNSCPPTYPVKSEWKGIPKTHIAFGLFGLLSLANVGLFSYDYNLQLTRDALVTMEKSEQASFEKPKKAIRSLVSQHIAAYARVKSVDVKPVIDASLAVWRPGLVVTGEATLANIKLTVKTDESNQPTGVMRDPNSHRLVQRILDIEPPPGFHITERRVSTSGDGLIITMQGKASHKASN